MGRKYSHISDTLCVLPCNDGVVYGDYYKGGKGSNNWTSARKSCPSLSDLFIAAVDCGPVVIPEFRADAKNGCLVFEDEMHRVFSTYDHGTPTYAITSHVKLIELTKAIEIGLKRAVDPDEYGFKRIIGVVPVFWYRIALFRAIENLSMWNTCTMFDTCMCGYGRMLASRADLLKKFPPGLIRGTFSRLPGHTGVKWTKKEGFDRQCVIPKTEALSDRHKWYHRIPPHYRYVDYAPQPEVDPELLSLVINDWRNTRTDWKSLFEAEEDVLV